jgi:hypothetical protein
MGGVGVRVVLRGGDVPDDGGGGTVDVTIDDGHLEPGDEGHQDFHGGDDGPLAGGGGNIAVSHKDLGKHSGGGGNVDDGHNKDTQHRDLHEQGGQRQDLHGQGGQVDLLDGGDVQKPGDGVSQGPEVVEPDKVPVGGESSALQDVPRELVQDQTGGGSRWAAVAFIIAILIGIMVSMEHMTWQSTSESTSPGWL